MEDIDPTVSESDLQPIHIDMSPAFRTAKIFSTCEAVHDWVREVGRFVGVVAIIVRSEKYVKSGTRDKIIFGCEKQGKLVNKDKVFGSRRKCCPFKLKATCTIKHGGWGVKVMNGRHNHELLITLVGSLSFGSLKEHEKRKVNEHLDLDVAPKKTLTTLKMDDPLNVTTIGHIYQQRHKH